MERDTLALRAWLDANGRAGVPLDINEFGAPTGVADWGAQTAQYTQWALCTPALHVEDIQPFWWGAISMADTDPWASMVDSELSETPLGTAYLSEVETLTTQGCPTVATPAPATPTSSPRPTIKQSKIHGRRKPPKPIRHTKHHPRKQRHKTGPRHKPHPHARKKHR
jgi:hypothetical protein